MFRHVLFPGLSAGSFVGPIVSFVCGAWGVLGACSLEARANEPLPGLPSALRHPSFGAHWYDGKAEVASYDATVERYGERRTGTAVLIFVTETSSNAKRVKVNEVKPGSPDQFPVMKLNFVLDFPTGIYDYNVMQSTFVALAPAAGVFPGAVTKATFSSQEWCGHVFEQFVPRQGRVEHTVHSYFEDEEKKERAFDVPADGVFGDGLFHWARGFSGPNVAPGKDLTAKLLTMSLQNRFRHTDPRWEAATFGVDSGTQDMRWDGGTLRVRRKWVRPASGGLAEFHVEEAFPHRLVRWAFSGGSLVAQEGRLVAAERNTYWSLNGKDGTKALAPLKLSPRPPRTP